MSFSCCVFSLKGGEASLGNVFLGANMFGTLYHIRGDGDSPQILPLSSLPPLLDLHSIPFSSSEKEGHGLVIKVDLPSLFPEIGILASGPGGPRSTTMLGVSRGSLEEAVVSLFQPKPMN